MSLFSINDLNNLTQEENKSQGSSIRFISQPSPMLLSSLKSLKIGIGDLEKNIVLPFATGGSWSLHQLMEYILIQTGPCKLWFTTWTISEEPLRCMVEMIKKGLITELNAILDYRIAKNKPEAFQLAGNIITNIRLTKCHAKVLVLKNSEWQVTVIGSANLSKNPRLEAGVIFTDEKTAQFNIDWIEKEIYRKEGGL